jgi:Tfp pilus assembly protein FimT
MNRGATLPELLLVLLLMGMVTPVAWRHTRAQMDALAVRAAREAVVGLFHRARTEARVSGDARVLILEGGGVYLQNAEGETMDQVVPGQLGVELRIRGERTEAEVRFRSLGLAAFASATLEFERGRRGAELTVSGYGRIRR